MYEQCDVGNMMNVWFKGELRKNRPVSGHVPVAHGRKIWIIGKFEQKIDFGEKYVFGQIFGQTWKKVIFSDFGDMCHCGLPGSQAMDMIWVS